MKIVPALYKKLLALYPRAFREQLGESMAQTFNDLYHERNRQIERGWFGFILWLFIETAGGIIKEHILSIKERNMMKNIFTNLRSPALISFILILPFLILEFIFNIANKPGALNLKNIIGFTLLFGLLWLLPMTFMAILAPVVRSIRAGEGVMANPVGLLLKAIFLALIALLWGAFLIDQLPCFLGVPNCD